MTDLSPGSVYDFDDLIDEFDPDYQESPYIIDATLPYVFPYNPEVVGKVSHEWRELLSELGVGRIKMPPSQVKPTDALIGMDGAFLSDHRKLFRELLGLKLSEVAFGNRLGCATALAAAWLEQGGTGVLTTLNGIGELPALEEVRLILHVTGKLPLPSDAGQKLKRIKELYEIITGGEIAKLSPILGDGIFAVESGIHVDGILKDPALYEPFPPNLVGGKRYLGVGINTGITALRVKCSLLGIYPPGEILDPLLMSVKEKALELERGLTDEELVFLIKKFQKKPR
jgi:homocitrate synthase NifV